jgi:hypothetical protein
MSRHSESCVTGEAHDRPVTPSAEEVEDGELMRTSPWIDMRRRQ